jgi:hypothetical protein
MKTTKRRAVSSPILLPLLLLAILTVCSCGDDNDDPCPAYCAEHGWDHACGHTMTTCAHGTVCVCHPCSDADGSISQCNLLMWGGCQDYGCFPVEVP